MTSTFKEMTMALSAGPHVPKPGWAFRWIRQGAALSARSPEALVLTGLMTVVVGLVHEGVRIGLHEVIGGEALPSVISAVALTPFAAFGVLLVTNALRAADTGDRSGVIGMWSSAREVIAALTLIVAAFCAVAGLVLVPMELGSGAVTFEPASLETILMSGADEAITGLVPMAILSPFTIGAVLMRRMSPREIYAQKVILMGKAPLVVLSVFFAILAGSLIPEMLPVYAQIPFALLAIAALYVGSREVILGDDENGTPRTVTRLAPLAPGA